MIRVDSLFKIFGPDPVSILPMIRGGHSKQSILAETGHTVALNDINLEIGKSSVFVIMGLSGSGKSTLIRHFNRLVEPTQGGIYVDGDDVLLLSPKQLRELRRHRISMVFQRFALLPHCNVLENIAFGLNIQKINRAEADEQARKWLATVELDGYEAHYPAELSGGQQQRVGLARALSTNPEILLMDEPFSALDPLIRSGMQDQLIDLQAELEKTIVFITHDLHEALRLGDTIAILKDGVLVQVGSPDDILHNPADDYVKAFVKDVKRTYKQA